MKNGGYRLELVGRGHDDQDDKHDEAGSQLSAIGDADAEGNVVECVDLRDGDCDGRFPISQQEANFLRMGIKGSHGLLV